MRGVSACKICFVGDCIAFVQDESFDMDYMFNQVSNRFNQIKNTILVSFHVDLVKSTVESFVSGLVSLI